jgi:membrane associated rhomboid family serine protease
MIQVLSFFIRDAVWANLSADWIPLYQQHQAWRIVTSPFIHHNPLHFLGNLFFLCLFGWQIEPIYGKVKTLSIFFGAMVTGHVLSISAAHDWNVGISGGVCGLFGFSLIAYRRNPWWTTLTHRPLHAIFLFSLAFAFLPFLSDIVGFRTSHISHLGGIVYGLAFGAVFLLMPQDSRRRGAMIALPFLLIASQVYSPWQVEWRLVMKQPKLLTTSANCQLRSPEQSVYTPAPVTFVNASTKPIGIYWLDYEGKAEYKLWLRPGDSEAHHSFVGHPFCMVDVLSGEALQAITVTQPEQMITIR